MSDQMIDPDRLPVTSPGWQRAAHRVTRADWFQNLVVAVIVANAAVIGLETYAGVRDGAGGALALIDRIFLGFFILELALRVAAAGLRLDRFLRNGWNVFDTLVVTASLVPGLQGNSTMLRLVRLLRVTRLLRLFPDLRVLLDGLRRAAPPAASLVALTFLLLYLYAIVGWTLFGAQLPHRFGNLGEGMLTLFTLLTLEGWNEILRELREVSAWALPYTLSFILVGTFVVLNLVIGVVITSLDEAYGERRREREGSDLPRAIDDVREALDALERRLGGMPVEPRVLSLHGDGQSTSATP